jgi:hypothetical protein
VLEKVPRPDIHRLILKVQTQRYALAEVRMIAEAACNKVAAEMPNCRSAHRPC